MLSCLGIPALSQTEDVVDKKRTILYLSQEYSPHSHLNEHLNLDPRSRSAGYLDNILLTLFLDFLTLALTPWTDFDLVQKLGQVPRNPWTVSVTVQLYLDLLGALTGREED